GGGAVTKGTDCRVREEQTRPRSQYEIRRRDLRTTLDRRTSRECAVRGPGALAAQRRACRVGRAVVTAIRAGSPVGPHAVEPGRAPLAELPPSRTVPARRAAGRFSAPGNVR